MGTLLLYLFTPSGHDGVSSAVRFMPLPGGPDAACHVIAVELPSDQMCLEPGADGGTVLVWRFGRQVYRYTAAEVFSLARHDLGGFRIADSRRGQEE